VSKGKTVVLGVTGSIAAYKAADIIRRLQDKQFHVSVIMTHEAKKFITPLTLGSLAQGKVYSDMFDDSGAAWSKSHIKLADEAEILLIAPATANIIGKIAHGIADDLLTCTVMATKAKVLIAPAMNVVMYQNAIVQENIRKLQKHGVQLIPPIKGKLACGTIGEGHLAEVDDIVNAVIRVQ
jgi:phosphopantothenoylcysteine decarboxylase / phosphopantothenate---cysteine ligase